MEALEQLKGCALKTIQDSDLVKPLLTAQRNKFVDTLAHLRQTLTDDPQRAHLVYRGEKLTRLASRLSTKGDKLPRGLIPGLLFYFGDKARHFYEVDDCEAMKLRWLKMVEDCDESTCSAIFSGIVEILHCPKYCHFRAANEEFTDYFMADNSAAFVSRIRDDQHARDYYLYLLHTAGRSFLNGNTMLVSTTVSYSEAVEFSGGPPRGCIIYYVVPEPLEDHAVSHMRIRVYESELRAEGLPTYDNAALYPKQEEIAVRGALFAHRILGLRILKDNEFIVNPYLFEEGDSAERIIQGLKIDQRDFEKRLGGTSYARGVGTCLPGHYATIAHTARQP